jgi:hypothetical protein
VMVRLQPAERAVILEILRTTKPDFATFEATGFEYLDKR